MSESLVYTVNEAAEALHIHPNRLYQMLREQQIHSVRVGRKILVPKIAIQRYLGELDGQETTK